MDVENQIVIFGMLTWLGGVFILEMFLSYRKWGWKSKTKTYTGLTSLTAVVCLILLYNILKVLPD